MIVRATVDGMNNVTLEPQSVYWCDRFAAYMRREAGRADATAFIQEATEEDLSFIPRRKVRDLMEGWPITFLMSPSEYGHLLGHDAHTVGEGH